MFSRLTSRMTRSFSLCAHPEHRWHPPAAENAAVTWTHLTSRRLPFQSPLHSDSMIHLFAVLPFGISAYQHPRRWHRRVGHRCVVKSGQGHACSVIDLCVHQSSLPLNQRNLTSYPGSHREIPCFFAVYRRICLNFWLARRKSGCRPDATMHNPPLAALRLIRGVPGPPGGPMPPPAGGVQPGRRPGPPGRPRHHPFLPDRRLPHTTRPGAGLLERRPVSLRGLRHLA
jgi:hypothetical protein